jgi:hypothetical protein
MLKKIGTHNNPLCFSKEEEEEEEEENKTKLWTI